MPVCASSVYAFLRLILLAALAEVRGAAQVNARGPQLLHLPFAAMHTAHGTRHPAELHRLEATPLGCAGLVTPEAATCKQHVMLAGQH